MVEVAEIYITSVRYKSQTWFNEPDQMLDDVANYLNEINSFSFLSLSLNMSQVHSVSLVTTQYDAMMLYLKGVKYQGSSFLTNNQIHELREKIVEKLKQLPEFEFTDVQIRSALKYEYHDLFDTTVDVKKSYEFNRR